jgi:uncharacterized membrane protein (DUF373 family)
MSIGAGLVLIAVGAILRFVIATVSTHGLSIHTIGDILILIGILGVVLWLMVWAPWGYRRRSVYRRQVRSEVPPTRVYPGDRPYVDEYEDEYRR